MKKNATRYGLGSLAIASLTLFCSGALAQDATFNVSPKSGFEILLVDTVNTVTLSDPNSTWVKERLIWSKDGEGSAQLDIVWDPIRSSGTASNYYNLSAGTYHFYCTDYGTMPDGSLWKLDRGPQTVIVYPALNVGVPVIDPPIIETDPPILGIPVSG